MKKAIPLFIFFFISHFLVAQLPDSTVGQFTTNFLMGIPSGDFADKMDDFGYGVDVGYLAKIKNSPFFAGARFGYVHFSRHKIDVNEPIGETGFNREYNWVTASQAIFLSASFRLQPKVKGPFQPYFQADIGGRRLFTNTKLINSPNRNSDANGNFFRPQLEIADWTVFYNGKAGVQFILTKDQVLALDLGCSFSYAGGAGFFRKKHMIGPISEPLDAFELRSASSTAMFIPSLGFSFNISKCSDKE